MKIIVLVSLIASFVLSVYSIKFVREMRTQRIEAQTIVDQAQSKFATVEARDQRMRKLVVGDKTVAPTQVAALLSVADVFNRFEAAERIRVTGMRSSRGQIGGDGVALQQLFAASDTSGLAVAPLEYSFVLSGFNAFDALVRELDQLSVVFGDTRVDQDNGQNVIVQMKIGVVAKASAAAGNSPFVLPMPTQETTPRSEPNQAARPRLSTRLGS